MYFNICFSRFCVPQHCFKAVIRLEADFFASKGLNVEFASHGGYEIPKALLDRGNERFFVLASIFRKEDFYAVVDALHFDVGLHHHRLTVDVHHPGFGAVEGERRGAERLDVGVLVDVLGEKQNAEHGCVERCERLDERYID